jgi:hypothetical protein
MWVNLRISLGFCPPLLKTLQKSPVLQLQRPLERIKYSKNKKYRQNRAFFLEKANKRRFGSGAREKVRIILTGLIDTVITSSTIGPVY